jgi:hypothetical protein
VGCGKGVCREWVGRKGGVGNGWGLGRKGEEGLWVVERVCVGNGWGGREGCKERVGTG